MSLLDTALTQISSNGKPNQGVLLRFPNAIARALIERGYNRATIEIIDDGILIRPYTRSVPGRVISVVDLPDSWGDAA